MTADKIHLSVPEAQAKAEAALLGLGYSASESRIIALHVLDVALCGYDYSGLAKILQISRNPLFARPRHALRVVRETPVSLTLDGGNQNGMLALDQAADRAIELARATGLAAVGVFNTWMSGRSAYYVERIARAGLIGIHTVGSASWVAPPGGIRATLGTNPIAFGFPALGDPLVIDLSTAACVGTEIDYCIETGRQLPPGVAIDSDGRPTRDPALAKLGAVLPLAGHKGFALGLAMQALGVWAGSSGSPGQENGYLFMVMQPDLLLPLEEYRQTLAETMQRLRATPRQPGVSEIRMPGARAFAEREYRRIHGIEVDGKVIASLSRYAQGLAP